MSWLRKISSKSLYEETIGLSRDDRINHAVHHYLSQLGDFYNGLKNASDYDVNRIVHPDNKDEALLTGGIDGRDLLEHESARRGMSNIEDKYPHDSEKIHHNIGLLLGGIRQSPGAIEHFRSKVPSDIIGIGEAVPEFHQGIRNSSKMAMDQIPDITNRHGDVPIFTVNRPDSKPSNVLSEYHSGHGIAVYHPFHSSSLSGQSSPTEGDYMVSNTNVPDIIRHEVGHHVFQNILRNEFISGKSQDDDSLWNRVYKGSIHSGSNPIVNPNKQTLRFVTPEHIKNNLFLRNVVELNQDTSKRPISQYAMSNPHEWLAEAFSLVTHPDYQQIRKSFKTQSSLDALDYVQHKIGR